VNALFVTSTPGIALSFFWKRAISPPGPAISSTIMPLGAQYPSWTSCRPRRVRIEHPNAVKILWTSGTALTRLVMWTPRMTCSFAMLPLLR